MESSNGVSSSQENVKFLGQVSKSFRTSRRDNFDNGRRFDVDVPGGPVLKESNSAAPGMYYVIKFTPVEIGIEYVSHNIWLIGAWMNIAEHRL